EAIDRNSPLIKFLLDVVRKRTRISMSTIVSADHPIVVGTRLFFDGINDRKIFGLPPLSKKLHPVAMRFVDSGSAYDLAIVETEKGTVEVAFEVLEPPISIVLSGASTYAVPLARPVLKLGWQASVVDR